jgi:hypothetical protein
MWRIKSRDHFDRIRLHPVMHLQIVEVNTRLSGRYVASAPHSWTMRVGQQKPAVRAGTDQAAGLLSGQLFGPGGNTTLEYWIDGRRIRAAWKAPSRKRPCRSRPLPVDPSFFVSRRLHRIGSRIKRSSIGGSGTTMGP